MYKTIQIHASKSTGLKLLISHHMSLTKQYTYKPSDPLALDLHISTHISLTQQYRSKPPNPLAKDLLISYHMPYTKPCRSVLPNSWLRYSYIQIHQNQHRHHHHHQQRHTQATYTHRTHDPVKTEQLGKAEPAVNPRMGWVACHTRAQKRDQKSNKKRAQYPVKKS